MNPLAFWSATVVLILASIVHGQVDHRVNVGNSAVAGRALDRNSGVGTGGYNLTRPGFDGGAGANAIITGNVSGLGGFKANSPVLQNNQFRDTLPSAGLSGFQARSVGLPDVASNRTLAPTFYFGQEQTIPDAGYIRQGLNEPGSSRLISPYMLPPSPATPNAQRLQPNFAVQQPIRSGSGSVPPDAVSPSSFGAVSSPPLPPVPIIPSPPSPSPFQSAIDSSIFGARLSTTSTEAEATRPDLFPPRSAFPDGLESQPLPGESAMTKTKVTDKIDLSITPRPPADREAAARETGSAGDRRGIGVVGPAGIETGRLTGFAVPLNGQTPANLGDDRFADLYNAVGAAQAAGAKRLGFKLMPLARSPESKKAPVGLNAPGSPTPPSTMLNREPSDALARLATAAKWANDLLDDPVRTFVGKNQNKLNSLIAAGEQAMRMGEYYSAARHFELANTIDPRNPLPLLARGHALAAAGDYVSATQLILAGVARFPQIAAFRLDLPAVVGGRDVFDVRRADLEKKLGIRENCEFRFLLGYLELYSGLPEEGIKDLQKAAKQAPKESLISDFADIVVGLKEVPPLARP